MRTRSGMTVIGPVMLPVIDILTSGLSGWSVSITSSSMESPQRHPGLHLHGDLVAGLDLELLALFGSQGFGLGDEKLGPRGRQLRDLRLGPIHREHRELRPMCVSSLDTESKVIISWGKMMTGG